MTEKLATLPVLLFNMTPEGGETPSGEGLDRVWYEVLG